MRVAIVGTYPPTECGIATFTADVSHALRGHGVDVLVVPVDPPTEWTGPAIRRADRSSSVAAARCLNQLGVAVVLVQHEFGIYGGPAGDHILDFVAALDMPYAVTLHTVLPHFAPLEAAVLQQLCISAASVIVFTATARHLLLQQQLTPVRSLRILPHGAPSELYRREPMQDVRKLLDIPAVSQVMTTFGLLSEGKGIELAIRALARLVCHHPELRYIVAGHTHPEVVRKGGERYRDGLLRLVQELGLAGNVVFVNRFLSVEELADVLAITDVFCTPYRGEDQIVSGALTFALAAGCPSVSTSYRYARDVLAGGAGLIVPFDDDVRFAAAIDVLLRDGPQRTAAREAARDVAASMSWPTVGRALRGVLTNAASIRPTRPLLASAR